MRARLTPDFVKKASFEKAKANGDVTDDADRVFYFDEGMPCFGLMITKAEHKSFIYQYRAGTASPRMKLDGRFLRYEVEREKKNGNEGTKIRPPRVGNFTFGDAKRVAKAVQGAVARGRNPLDELKEAKAAGNNTLKSVAEDYFRREAKRLRSIHQRRATLERLVFPKFGSRQIDGIRRSEIRHLLDRIDDERGPVMADQTLRYLQRLFTWHASGSDEFRSPIVRGMARTRPKERARQRVLNDDELRAVWRAAGVSPRPFDCLVKFMLLTATRRKEAARMDRAELSGADWVIPGTRHKSKKDFLLPLSPAAMTLLAEVPIIGRHADRGYVFTHDGKRPLGGFSKAKRTFDEKVLAVLRQDDPEATQLPRWTIHDLRRTARTLMSRAGIEPDHAERAIGHVIPGIRGVYDLYAFSEEKARAFEALSAQIDRIINPQSNVVLLRDTKSGR
jgi:integrase